MKTWKDAHLKEKQVLMMKASDQGSNVRKASMLLASKIHIQGEFVSCIHICYRTQNRYNALEKPSRIIFES